MNWRTQVAIAIAIAVCFIALLLTTEGCSTFAKVECPNGVVVESRYFSIQEDQPDELNIPDACKQ